MSETNGFTNFIQLNSSFLLSTFTIIGFCSSGFLLYLLKSRCRIIRCCCCEMQRDVVSEDNINNVSLQSPNDSFTIANRV